MNRGIECKMQNTVGGGSISRGLYLMKTWLTYYVLLIEVCFVVSDAVSKHAARSFVPNKAQSNELLTTDRSLLSH